MDIVSLLDAYRERQATPSEVMGSLLAAMSSTDGEGIWSHRRSGRELLAEARSLERVHSRGALPPLFGVPFAVDGACVAGSPGPVIDRLRSAGALFVGKGSAAAVALGQVAFALATDAVGSRGAASAMNDVVAFKPSRGSLRTAGLLPACRSVDGLAILALTWHDARTVAAVAAGRRSGSGVGRR